MGIYAVQKKAELDWFKKISEDLSVPTTFDPLMTKFKLMKEIKAKTLLSLANSVTMIWPIKESFYGKKINYRYQRQDLVIEGPAPLEVFYPGLKSSLNVTGHFTRSGQSATFGTAQALKNWETNFTLKFLTSMIYFETIRVFDGLKISRKQDADTGFLDSSTLETDPLTALNGLKLKRLLVDTTNWCFTSANIQNVIDWSKKHNVELFLLRSHLKLDCLGAEYGLLGSVVRIASEENKEWDKFFLETLSYAGLLAVHEQIFPFLWDKEFIKLTEARTERIRANTKYLTTELAKFIKELKHPLRLKILDHGLFFGVFYQGKADHHPEKFLKLSMMHQVPAKYCDSFGFDFLSLTNVVSFHENIQESSLRFCSGDNIEQIEDSLKLIKDYLVFFDQRT